MIDNFNRNINYLRVSLTQSCNYNCLYCMPNPKDKPLSLKEINRFIKIFSALNIEHIKFSGGEPLIRDDLNKIIEKTKQIPSIKTISITTNASLLENKIESLQNSGLDSINISIDATHDDLYKKLTGGHKVEPIIRAIDKAIALNLNIKINSILLEDIWIEQLEQLITLAKEKQLTLKLIELMPIGIATKCNGISSDRVIPYLTKKYGSPQLSKVKGNGPAKYMRFNNIDIGFIDALSHNFCSSCNRIRLLSNGDVKLCLYQDPSLNLREIKHLSDEKIASIITKSLINKNEHHLLKENSIKMSMASIGG